jgi:GH25 family lysozyme M1 (1,4-beta-N-acetylmuramidase)
MLLCLPGLAASHSTTIRIKRTAVSTPLRTSGYLFELRTVVVKATDVNQWRGPISGEVVLAAGVGVYQSVLSASAGLSHTRLYSNIYYQCDRKACYPLY